MSTETVIRPIQCCCGGRVRCEECRRDICYCECPFDEPTDAVLAGHGITTEPSDPYVEMTR